MKIIYVNNLYYPYAVGGAERSVQRLAEEMNAAGHDCVVATLGLPSDDATAQVNGVSVRRLGLHNVYWPFGSEKVRRSRAAWHAIDIFNPIMAAKFGRILAVEAPDLVHTHNLQGLSVAIWSSCKRYRVPIIHTLRDYYLLCPRSTLFRNGESCNTRCSDCRIYSSPKVARTNGVGGVVGISDFILSAHLEAGLFKEVPVRRVIGNPAPTFPKALPTRTYSPPLKFGFLGRLEPEKGIETLLSAIMELDPRSFALSIAGEGGGDYVARLRHQVRSLPVSFLGRSDPLEFLDSIDVLVVPSVWREPSGRVVLEAQARGAVVVASASGGITELISHRATGFLVTPGSPSELQLLLKELVATPATLAAIAVAARRGVSSRTSANLISEHQRLYTQILSSREPS